MNKSDKNDNKTVPNVPQNKKENSVKKPVHSAKNNGNGKSAKSFRSNIVNSEEFNRYVAPLPDNVIKAKRRRQWIVDDQQQIKAEPAVAPVVEKTEEKAETKAEEKAETNANKKTVTISLKQNEENPEESEKAEVKEENVSSEKDEEKNQAEAAENKPEEKSEEKTADKKEEKSEEKDQKPDEVAVVKEFVEKKPEEKSQKKKTTENKKSANENQGAKLAKGAKPAEKENKKEVKGNPQKKSGSNKKKNPSGKNRKKSKDDIINITDIRKARKKEKNRYRTKRLIIAGAVVLAGIIIYLLRGFWVPKLEGILDKPHKTIVNDGKTEEGNFPIEIDKNSDTEIDRFGNYFITVDKNHILMYDESGEKSGSFTHTYSSPVLKTSKKRIMVYDYGGNSFRVMTRKKEIYSKNTEKSILMGGVADNGNALVVTQSEKYECKLIVYDTSGSEIFSWESGKIVNVSFTDGGNGCVVSSIISDGGEIKSVIYKLDFNSSTPKMKSEALPTLAIDVRSADDNGFFVVGDNCLYKLNSEGKVYFRYEYTGELDGYAVGEKGALVSCKGASGNSENLVFFKSGDDKYPTSGVKSENGVAKKFKYSDNGFILLENGNLEAYDFSGNLIATAAISSDYSDFVFINQNAYFVSKNEINKIQFKTE